jgi:hypothetical protein
MEKKICSKCKLEKDVCEFNRKSVSNKGKQYYKSWCKNCQSRDNKVKRLLNPEKYKVWYSETRKERNEYRSKYYQRNKEKILTQNKKQTNKRNIARNKKYNEDPVFKIKRLLSTRIKEVLKLKSFNKKQTYNSIVGCSPEFLMEHIEKQFTEGMSWENHGLYGWHIDHIVPLSSAKTEKEIYKLSHFTNLQPLWAKDNLKKSDKISN